MTEREREILVLLVQKHSVQEIADILVLSIKTVRNHISNILSKLQVGDRAKLMLMALEAGMGQGEGKG